MSVGVSRDNQSRLNALYQHLHVPNIRDRISTFDLSRFSIKEVGRIYEFARNADDWWGSLSNMPLCEETSGGFSPIGWFIEFENQRRALLRDPCVKEIARRVPANEDERDEILRVRIMLVTDCSGQIHPSTEPSLLIEALKVWG